MKFHYAGKYSGNPEDLPSQGHEVGCVPFNEQKDIKAFSRFGLRLSTALILATLALTWVRAGEFFIGDWSVLLYLLTIVPHEIIHGLCYNGDVYIYQDLRHGLVFITGTGRMSKVRFIIKCLMPGIVFGFVPYIIFMINPALRTLGTLGALGIGSAALDYYNAYNALVQMPKGSWAYNDKASTYWYMPEKKIAS